jgi:hypothetical protein
MLYINPRTVILDVFGCLWSSQLPCNYPNGTEWIYWKVEVHLKITEYLERIRILTEPTLTILVLHSNINFMLLFLCSV